MAQDKNAKSRVIPSLDEIILLLNAKTDEDFQAAVGRLYIQYPVPELRSKFKSASTQNVSGLMRVAGKYLTSVPNVYDLVEASGKDRTPNWKSLEDEEKAEVTKDLCGEHVTLFHFFVERAQIVLNYLPNLEGIDRGNLKKQVSLAFAAACEGRMSESSRDELVAAASILKDAAAAPDEEPKPSVNHAAPGGGAVGGMDKAGAPLASAPAAPPAMPELPISGYKAIFEALNATYSKEAARSFKAECQKNASPVIFPGNGKKPHVLPSKLHAWVAGAEDRLRATAAKSKNEKATVVAGHSYGKQGRIVKPEISGHVKKRT